MKALPSFRNLGTIYPLIQRNILKDLNIQQHRCENRKWSVSVNSLKRTRRLTMGRDSDSLPPGRSGDRTPVGGQMLHPLPDRPWGPPALLYNGYRVCPGGKTAGECRSPPIPPGAEVKERVELYLYPFWAFVASYRVNFTFTFTFTFTFI
jgi:hypothetical protein